MTVRDLITRLQQCNPDLEEFEILECEACGTEIDTEVDLYYTRRTVGSREGTGNYPVIESAVCDYCVKAQEDYISSNKNE